MPSAIMMMPAYVVVSLNLALPTLASVEAAHVRPVICLVAVSSTLGAKELGPRQGKADED